MTDEMVDLARRNAEEAGVANVEFLQGEMEHIPLPDAAVDVVISNCVINLSTDKAAVIGESARVLRPGGRFAVTDVIADADMDDATRRDEELWTGCIAGALTRAEFTGLLAAAGFTDIEVLDTHRVHAHASSAIIRARKPNAADLNRTVPSGIDGMPVSRPGTGWRDRAPRAARPRARATPSRQGDLSPVRSTGTRAGLGRGARDRRSRPRPGWR